RFESVRGLCKSAGNRGFLFRVDLQALERGPGRCQRAPKAICDNQRRLPRAQTEPILPVCQLALVPLATCVLEPLRRPSSSCKTGEESCTYGPRRSAAAAAR